MKPISLFGHVTTSLAAWILWCGFAVAADDPIQLELDASRAPQHWLHAQLIIPASPGSLTLFYPKWIPGEHAPTGPIQDQTGLKIRAKNQELTWRRNPHDMFEYLVSVPEGADRIEVELDFLLPPKGDGFSAASSTSEKLAVINWNQVVLYPKGKTIYELQFRARVRMPSGWKFGTALPLVNAQDGMAEFSPVSLETLMDSPVIMGQYFKRVNLGESQGAEHWLNVAADSPEALEFKPEIIAGYSNLVLEINALFGAHHYHAYNFLLALSDQVAHFGLEHHQSSDNRAAEFALVKEDLGKTTLGLLPHEMTHSWNGKYRRPAGLIRPDYQQSWDTELLWVYEGLTTYLGEVLTTRAGLWREDDFHQELGLLASAYRYMAGRNWRPLVDTAAAAQLLYFSRADGRTWRRSVDFYDEGLLIWLEADVKIRQLTQDQRSLDDFCRQFFGGESSSPEVKPYELTDVIKALNEVAVYDWKAFFHSRVEAVNTNAPLAGITEGGWHLVFKDEPCALQKIIEGNSKGIDLSSSIGLMIDDGGVIIDVIPGSASSQAGLSGTMKILAVNGRRWSAERLSQAVKETKDGKGPLELVVENGDYYKTTSIAYHDGARYPHLERDDTKPDRLHTIISPRARQTKSAP
jgi:predicted metalloprotease with PDZ domain